MSLHRIAFILRSKANHKDVCVIADDFDLSAGSSILDLNVRELIEPYMRDCSFNDPELVDFQIAIHEYVIKTD